MHMRQALALLHVCNDLLPAQYIDTLMMVIIEVEILHCSACGGTKALQGVHIAVGHAICNICDHLDISKLYWY